MRGAVGLHHAHGGSVGANDFIVGEENGLARQATKVADESDPTSAQKAALATLTSWAAQIVAAINRTDQVKATAAAKISTAQAGLTARQSKVDAASSPARVAALMRAAHFGDQLWRTDDPSKLAPADPAHWPRPSRPRVTRRW